MIPTRPARTHRTTGLNYVTRLAGIFKNNIQRGAKFVPPQTKTIVNETQTSLVAKEHVGFTVRTAWVKTRHKLDLLQPPGMHSSRFRLFLSPCDEFA